MSNKISNLKGAQMLSKAVLKSIKGGSTQSTCYQNYCTVNPPRSTCRWVDWCNTRSNLVLWQCPC